MLSEVPPEAPVLTGERLVRKNLDFKATVDDRDDFVSRVEKISDSGRVEMTQDDTYFDCQHGTLTLRTRDGEEGRLIFSASPDEAGPALSVFTSTSTAEAEALRNTLALAYGVTGRVQIDRLLYIAHNARIHLDRVEGLGDFVDLEVALNEEIDESAAREGALALMHALGIVADRFITGSYFDVVAGRSRAAGFPAAS